MEKIKIGIICPSEIAFRRFMPALKKIENIDFIGIAHADEEEWFGNVIDGRDLSVLKNDLIKANEFTKKYGGKVFNSFKELICSNEIDSIYIPLPPALHYKWAKLALNKGKNVLVEKPATVSLSDTIELINIAKERNLSIHENYMFNFHNQIEEIEKIIKKKEIGEIRLMSIYFGFPFRGTNDFRYKKQLGGGALLDCGGYTLKLANRLLGGKATIVCHKLNYSNSFDVDIYGSGTLENKGGDIIHIAFGMDNYYKCDLDIWGSLGTIHTGRVLTAPEGFNPIIQISKNGLIEERKLPSDDSFMKSIQHFIKCIGNDKIREETYDGIVKQAQLVNKFMEEK